MNEMSLHFQSSLKCTWWNPAGGREVGEDIDDGHSTLGIGNREGELKLMGHRGRMGRRKRDESTDFSVVV